jgi:hypothetical protein
MLGNKDLATVFVAAVAFAKLSFPPITAQAATYDYVAPQVAPPIAATLGTADIAAILNETAPNKPYPSSIS